jgi:hypothetical protein
MLEIIWTIFANSKGAEIYCSCPDFPEFLLLVNSFSLNEIGQSMHWAEHLARFLDHENTNLEFNQLMLVAPTAVAQNLQPYFSHEIQHKLCLNLAADYRQALLNGATNSPRMLKQQLSTLLKNTHH